MNKKLSFLAIAFLCLLTSSRLQAQYHLAANRVWAFGHHMGMDFSGPSPVPVSTSMIHGEGCASVCNDDGELLFYANGNKVWSANGNLMPHGQNMAIPQSTATTTTQTALVVPAVNDANKFYLFTLGARLFVYRIDMTLNGGWGDVDTTFVLHQVMLRDSLTEKMIAIPGCNNNVWVLVKSTHTGEFLAYNVTTLGVSTKPIASVAGFAPREEYTVCTMCPSPDGHKIAVNTWTKLELLNFDITRGKVSNGRVLDNKMYYGVCFSPNGRYVYTNGSGIYQYDLTSCDPAATRVTVGDGFVGDIRLAPDHKIYFRANIAFNSSGYNFLGSIERPDLPGAACQFRDSVTGTAMLIIDPSSVATNSLGLHNTVAKAGAGDRPLNRSYFDTCVCKFPYSAGITLTAEAGFTNHQWSNGATTESINVKQPGVYHVMYETSCGRRTDTFKVRTNMEPVTLTYNTPLLITSGTYQSYKWYKDGIVLTGAAGATYTPAVTGTYSVVVTNTQGCTDSVFLHVNMGATGIPELSAGSGLLLYPNPATDLVYIESDVPLGAIVTDLSGRTLLTVKAAQTIDISHLKAGVYLVKLIDKNGNTITVKKVTKTDR